MAKFIIWPDVAFTSQ